MNSRSLSKKWFVQRVIIALTMLLGTAFISAETLKIPRRISAVPGTTNSVPHVQIDVKTDAALSAQLLRRVAAIQGVEIRGSGFSLPGAKGFVIGDDITITRQHRIIGGREFGHMHPDGSLHLSLPSETAVAAVQRGWATYHPWSTERPGWDGLVMIYTPQSKDELQVIVKLILASYDFMTGKH